MNSVGILATFESDISSRHSLITREQTRFRRGIPTSPWVGVPGCGCPRLPLNLCAFVCVCYSLMGVGADVVTSR